VARHGGAVAGDALLPVAMDTTTMKKTLVAVVGFALLWGASEANAQSKSFFRNYSSNRLQFNNRAAARSISRPKKAPTGQTEPRPLPPGEPAANRPKP
jgi:hypothetical protein